MLRPLAALRQRTDRKGWADPPGLKAFLQKTDQEHWANPRAIHPAWEPRTRMAAGFIPKNSRVIEFGAANRVLEKYLDSSCTYVPSDLVDRGPGTIVCDLNERPLPDLGDDTFDVAVMLGVLEYLRDVPSLLDWLAELVPTCVISYACARPARLRLRGRLGLVGRLHMGWMNNYSEKELRELFRQRGFTLLRDDTWEKQRLFVFSRQPSVIATHR